MKRMDRSPPPLFEPGVLENANNLRNRLARRGKLIVMLTVDHLRARLDTVGLSIPRFALEAQGEGYFNIDPKKGTVQFSREPSLKYPILAILHRDGTVTDIPAQLLMNIPDFILVVSLEHSRSLARAYYVPQMQSFSENSLTLSSTDSPPFSPRNDEPDSPPFSPIQPRNDDESDSPPFSPIQPRNNDESDSPPRVRPVVRKLFAQCNACAKDTLLKCPHCNVAYCSPHCQKRSH
jgi:hypothetical protein